MSACPVFSPVARNSATLPAVANVPMRAFLFLCLLVFPGLFAPARAATSTVSAAMQPLSPEEARVILNKGTERPFSGKYDKFFENGVYVCRQCGAPLYASKDKFDSGCGWPAFDDAIPGAVLAKPDADGRRTEIVCAHCGGHLGHVFTGEQLTPKDTRHCVNSISLLFVPADQIETAVVAGGCFWGVEALMRGQKGVMSVESGYTGGTVPNPSYEQVCTGASGHLEAVKITFDRRRVSYETVLKLFFEIHDFTQTNGQGPDIGPQYRSAVFYADPAQQKTALALIEQLQKKGYRVATQVLPLGTFYPAEDYHQRYYERTGKQPYCHFRRTVF